MNEGVSLSTKSQTLNPKRAEGMLVVEPPLLRGGRGSVRQSPIASVGNLYIVLRETPTAILSNNCGLGVCVVVSLELSAEG